MFYFLAWLFLVLGGVITDPTVGLLLLSLVILLESA